MPRRRRIHVPGGFYHVTLRGNHRQRLFTSDADRFLLNKIVARAIEKYGARLHAYCWMGNHLHFLLQVGVEKLGKPMRKIAAEFARAMQLGLDTSGHFFERRHHATLIEATDYLFTVLRYIHNNPVEAGFVDAPDDYRWSSHHAYCGRRDEPWLTTGFILAKFAPDRPAAFAAYSSFMAAGDDEARSSFPEGAFIFGSDEFIARIRGADPQARSPQSLQELVAEACRKFGVIQALLTSSARNRRLVKIRAWIAHEASERGIANRSEVARAVGRTEGALRRAVLMYRNEQG
jgi:REP element-mobilizing transposase RayT